MDWLAGFGTLYCVWLEGNKKPSCWILSFFLQFLWLYIEVKAHLYGLLVITIPMIFLCVRNYKLWKK